MLIGVLLLTLVSGYYAYSAGARSQLDSLNYQAQPAAGASTQTSHTGAIAPQSDGEIPPANGGASQPQAVSAPPTHADRIRIANQQDTAARPPSSYAALYPATLIHPKFWAQPLWAGGEPYAYNPDNPGDALPHGFRAVSAAADALPRGDGAPTTRIAIPSIGVDSETRELSILNLGDSRAYETPKHLVGHIPQSSNPGEIGNAWYFGHLESPIRGEGNVFHRLPEIPNMLRDGDDVFVELATQDGSVFLYKTTRTEVVHQTELHLYGADVAQISLVACVPRLVYDHRIVITAELVGVKDVPGALN